jgi:hypothetical protein
MTDAYGYNYRPLPRTNIQSWESGRYGSNRRLCDKIAGDNHFMAMPPGISVVKRWDGLITVMRSNGHHSMFDPKKGAWDTFIGPSKL